MNARLLAVAALLALLAVWTHARPSAATSSSADFERSIPMAFDEWIGQPAPPLEPEIAKVLAADEYVHRYYDVRGAENAEGIAPIEMDIAYYAQPQAGAAMHSPLNCLPGNGWQVIESRRMPVSLAPETVNVKRLVIARGGYRLAMSYWFQNRGAVVGSEYGQRLQLVSNGLQGRSTDAALVRVMADDTPEGRVLLDRFTANLLARTNAAFQ
jgi:EpsI family protein